MIARQQPPLVRAPSPRLPPRRAAPAEVRAAVWRRSPHAEPVPAGEAVRGRAGPGSASQPRPACRSTAPERPAAGDAAPARTAEPLTGRVAGSPLARTAPAPLSL